MGRSMGGGGSDIKLGKDVLEIGGLGVIINEEMENSGVEGELRGG